MERRRNLLQLFLIVLSFIGNLIILANIYKFRRQGLHDNQCTGTRKPASCAPTATSPIPRKADLTLPIVWLNSDDLNAKHVINVFERMNFVRGNNESDWTVLWSRSSPFYHYPKVMRNIKPYQKVNHFPGTPYLTHKLYLATSNLKCVPKAFSLPNQKSEFLKHAEKFPEKKWVQKSIHHRGISIKAKDEINFTNANSFIQEFVEDPLLIDGRKFDIGIYTVITSIDPLRVYYFHSDVRIRFCPEPYLPFDANNSRKYIVADGFTPVWEIPTLAESYHDFSFNFKKTLNVWLDSNGYNSARLYSDIIECIGNAFLANENRMIAYSSRYKSTSNFFELMRFDFAVDSKQNVFLMEANMSPNLASRRFPLDAVLFEQVIFSALNVAGLGARINYNGMGETVADTRVLDMLISDRDLATDNCGLPICMQACSKLKCKLCPWCMRPNEKLVLKRAILEHMYRHNCRRIWPPPMKQNVDQNITRKLSRSNKLMVNFFFMKCAADSSWCS